MNKKLVEVEKLAITDPLTNLYNRRGFTMFAEQQIKYSLRTNQMLRLYFIDIDNLKVINDQLGHKKGDLAIVSIATFLKKSFRQSDIIARIGGDEFSVLALSNITEISHIENRLDGYDRIDAPFKLSVSIGISEFDPKNPCSVDELIAKADKSMYKQKKAKTKS